jgi:hypothetical protein
MPRASRGSLALDERAVWLLHCSAVEGPPGANFSTATGDRWSSAAVTSPANGGVRARREYPLKSTECPLKSRESIA